MQLRITLRIHLQVKWGCGATPLYGNTGQGFGHTPSVFFNQAVAIHLWNRMLLPCSKFTVSTLQFTLKCLTLGEKYRKLSASQLQDYLPEGPLSWPVLYWGAQMIPRELLWKLSVVYRILQDYVECFPPQQTYWFLSPPLLHRGIWKDNF